MANTHAPAPSALRRLSLTGSQTASQTASAAAAASGGISRRWFTVAKSAWNYERRNYEGASGRAPAQAETQAPLADALVGFLVEHRARGWSHLPLADFMNDYERSELIVAALFLVAVAMTSFIVFWLFTL